MTAVKFAALVAVPMMHPEQEKLVKLDFNEEFPEWNLSELIEWFVPKAHPVEFDSKSGLITVEVRGGETIITWLNPLVFIVLFCTKLPELRRR